MSDDIDYRADELANAVIGMQKMINAKDATIAALRARCEAAEWKVEKAREAMKSSSSTYSVFDKLRQILK